MNKFLFTVYGRTGATHVESVLSIFPLIDSIDYAEAETLIASQLASMAPVDAIHFVGSEPTLRTIKELLSDEKNTLRARVFGALRGKTEGLHQSLLLFNFDFRSGEYIIRDINGLRHTNDRLLLEEKNRTLTHAFVNCGGEENAPSGSHFAKTSKSHSQRFLRVSRVLEHTGHVRLTAFWLLRRLWLARPKFVLIDTSGIHSIALVACAELVSQGQLTSMPFIWSHNSHEGIADISTEALSSAVFLISATTSGGLAKRLANKGVTSERLVTCFSLLQEAEDQRGEVLCNLLRDEHCGLDPIQSHSPADCPFCLASHQIIPIEGDQFSLTPPQIEKILIEAKDLDLHAKGTLSALSGRGVFHLYRRDAIDTAHVRDIWVDSGAVVKLPFNGKSKTLDKAVGSWHHYVSQAMTLNVTTVVASEYIGAAQLANWSLSSYHSQRAGIHGVRLRELKDLPEERGKATAVFVPAIDRQDELVSISRTMRSFQPAGCVSYLAMFSFFATAKERDALTSAITFGAHGRQTFRLNSLFNLDLEINTRGGSWALEVETLKRLRQWADNNEVDVPERIEQRISLLDNAPATGLIDNALWESPSGRKLKLRSDFTLLDWSMEEPAANTADLYVLFSIILNRLRHQNDLRRLTQNPYQRSVLAPGNFDRFSDGILQACILRASKKAELAYAGCDTETSAEMLGLLRDAIAKGLDDERAEAINEYLVALHTGTLTLHAEHLKLFIAELLQRCHVEMHSATHFLALAFNHSNGSITLRG